MEDAGLKTTDVGIEICDPTETEAHSGALSIVLDKEIEQDVKEFEAHNTADKLIADIAHDSGTEVPDEEIIDQAESKFPPSTGIAQIQDVTGNAKEEIVKQEDNLIEEKKKLDVHVNDCSITEEMEEKEDQNQNKVQNTPVAVRRSNRAKQSDTPSSVGRTTRSQINPDIIAKQKSFMHKYQIAVKSSMDSYVRSATSEPDFKSDTQANKRKYDEPSGSDSPRTSPVQEKKSKRSLCASVSITPKILIAPELLEKNVARHDSFCWTCHMDGQVMECIRCPRVFHQRCVQPPPSVTEKWLCTECVAVHYADKHNLTDNEQLVVMLSFAIERIKSVADSQPFFRPVDTEEFPHYTEYVVCPVDISQLEEKVALKAYASTRAFLADFRWILHNCIVFNSVQSKLTSVARTMMKVCKHEMAEIDTCADCYIHAHTKRETWFLEPCRRPHLLLWAKLKGFPHWPAKAMKANKEGNVDVRFFGAHDRAWVPAKDCYLYSREMPMQLKNQRKANLASSIEEVDQHIRKLVERYGPFVFPPPRTAYDPLKEDEQLQMLIPGYKVSEDACRLDSKTPEGDGESMQSDSEPGELTENNAHLALQTEDREEDRKFLAMLELAPRSAIEATNANSSAPVSRSESPSIITFETKSLETELQIPNETKIKEHKSKLSQKVNGVDSEPFDRSCTSTPILDSSGVEPAYCEILKDDANSTEALQIKAEPVEDHEDGDCESSTVTLSIDKVVGNYKPSPTAVRSRPDGVKVATKSGGMAKTPNSKTPAIKQPGPKITKSIAKVTPSRPIAPKPASVTKPPAKTNSRRNTGDEEDDLDPAMYLDPTITITLINNEEKKTMNKRDTEVAATGPISSSDLQALNALGENVSITVVPKRKVLQGSSTIRSKENEKTEQPMVIEVDPVSLHKNRAIAHTGKARKSFPKSSRSALPPNQPHAQKPNQKATNPPMVSIPSRHLSMDVARSTPALSSSGRVPSITVRPVTHPAPSQPSIILHSGTSDSAAAAKQPANSLGASGANNALNSLQTVVPETGLGNGGLFFSLNRTLSPFTAATPNSSASTAPCSTKSADSGPVSSQLSAKTQQIADMVRGTLETLLQEVSAAGNVEASVVQLQLELEKSRSVYQQEIVELKRSFQAQLATAESNKLKAIADLRRQFEAEKQRAIQEVKRKQWCAQCGQEAIFYCCWNTAYCDYPCQQSHWPEHMATCANANQNTETDAAESISSMEPPSETPSPQKTASVRSFDGENQ